MAGFGSSATARRPSGADLQEARDPFRNLDARSLDTRERVELQVGLAEVLYFDDRFGAAAELLDSVLDSSTLARSRRHTSARSTGGRPRSIAMRSGNCLRIATPSTRASSIGWRTRLGRTPSSTAASYWLVAATRGAGDLDRSWAAAVGGWVRAVLAPTAAPRSAPTSIAGDAGAHSRSRVAGLTTHRPPAGDGDDDERVGGIQTSWNRAE